MMNFNVKTGKEFRDTLALWHIADFKIADEILKTQKNINTLDGMIKFDESQLEKIANNDTVGVLKSKNELDAEIKDFNSRIESARKVLADFKSEQSKDIEKATALITEDLLKAVMNYVKDIHNDEYESALTNEFVKWFNANGFKDANAENVKPYIRPLGQKKNGARGKVKDGNHNKVGTKKEYVDIILGALCDEPSLRAMLPIYKFETIIEKKVRKNESK